MKKPCHIVPMEVKDAKTGEYIWRDVVLPGIYEYRITAHRTGVYLGHSEYEYGPDINVFGVTAPEWCAATFYRWNPVAQQKVPFPVKVFFKEVVATKKDKHTGQFIANARWMRAPRQMLTKCTEAPGLRETCPEEFGGGPTAEEMDGQRATDLPQVPPPVESPALTAFDELPEGLKDNIEKAFSSLNIAPGLRLAKINECLGGELTPEDGAQQILDWARDEFSKRKTGAPRKRKAADNAKQQQEKSVGQGKTAGAVNQPVGTPSGDARPIEAVPEQAPVPPADPLPAADLKSELF
jgi:hypothetical protein